MAEQESLQAIMEEAFASGKEQIVQDALKARVQVKKAIRSGNPVDKIDAFNALHTTVSSEARAALDSTKFVEDIRREGEILRESQLAKRLAQNPSQLKESLKRLNPFSAFRAFQDIRTSKNRTELIAKEGQ